jgi:hypothetical protein
MIFFTMLTNIWGISQGNWGPAIPGGEQGGYARLGSSIVVVLEAGTNTSTSLNDTFSMNGSTMFIIRNPS